MVQTTLVRVLVFASLVGGATLVSAQDDVLHIVGDKVGVGTSVPTERIHIKGEAPGLLWEDVDEMGDTDQVWAFRINGMTGRLNFRDETGGTTPFKLDPGADTNLFRVGILGDDTVDINGNLVVTGTITPDYVFEPGYALMPLDELERFIVENQHLPAVPSAEQIAEQGINVAEIQMRLLEKIEELVLYTLEQQVAIGEQRDVIHRLEARLEELESTWGRQ